MDVNRSNGHIKKLLDSKLKLERDKGTLQLKRLLMNKGNDNNQELIQDLQEHFLTTLQNVSTSTAWESIQGCLCGFQCLVESKEILNPEKTCNELQNCAKDFLTHEEVRVRLASGELLGSLCKFHGVITYTDLSETILNLVRENLHRAFEDGMEDGAEDGEKSSGRKRTTSSDSSVIYHDSAGWRHLETSMKCLQLMIEGCGKSFNPHVTQDLLDLVFKALTHENRFVRETGFHVCTSLVSIGHPDDSSAAEDESAKNCILKYGDQFSSHLSKGLSDNWSQVRLASSIATRHFLMSIPDLKRRRKFYDTLLPRICLNRYYVADGVRIYTQETWKQLSDGKGRDLVEEYINCVVEYYIESTKADNHAVREAACSCIAELGNKIRPDALKPHVKSLLQALLESFHDDSWPVRDAACVACGNFIVNFAEEARDVKDELYRLFLINLQDPISSVRQGAAGAVANYIKAYGKEALDTVVKEIKEGLDGIKTQPANTEKYIGLDKSAAQFGVVKSLRDNDADLHTNQTMYSCGSLAPKMGRGKTTSDATTGSRGGCTDCRFQRPSEPWERSDGCIYLLTEITAPELTSQVSELLPLIPLAASHHHYTQHVVFIETICHQLPLLAKRLGKRTFKPHLETFFDLIFYGLDCDTQLTSAAAEDCLQNLARFLGPSILRGRIEMCSTRYIEAYDRINQPKIPHGPGLGPSPGSLTPFPKPGFVPMFPTGTATQLFPTAESSK